jgi:hypothetical protein
MVDFVIKNGIHIYEIPAEYYKLNIILPSVEKAL